MNIKTKLTLNIGILVAMIVLLVSLSIVNLQILTATEPTSPAAEPGLKRALLWISMIGGIQMVSRKLPTIIMRKDSAWRDWNLRKYRTTSTGWQSDWLIIIVR